MLNIELDIYESIIAITQCTALIRDQWRSESFKIVRYHQRRKSSRYISRLCVRFHFHFFSLTLEGYQWQGAGGRGWFSFEKAGREEGSAPSTTGNLETHGRQRPDCLAAGAIVGESQLSENLFKGHWVEV